MIALRAAAPYLGMAAAAFVAWLLWGKIEDKNALLASQREAVEDLRRGVEDLLELHQETALQMKSLMLEQKRVATHFASQQTEIRRLQSDVEEVRDWAGQPLPDDIVRLRFRGTITGSSGYGADVRTGDSLRADGSSAEDER